MPVHKRCRQSTPEQQEIAGIGHDWLKNQQLRVVLVPAPDPKHRGHKIRVPVEHNPPWYSRMAQARGMREKGKAGKHSGPLRQQTLRALRRLIDGYFDPMGLEEEILKELKKDLTEQGWKPNAR